MSCEETQYEYDDNYASAIYYVNNGLNARTKKHLIDLNMYSNTKKLFKYKVDLKIFHQSNK